MADEEVGAVLLRISEIEAIELTLAYLDEVDRLAAAVGEAVREVFRDLTSIDRSEIEAFIAGAEPFTAAGQTGAADLAAAYLSEVLGETISVTDLRYPTIPFEDPFLRTWSNLKSGMPYDEAVAGGESMAEMIGHDATTNGASTASSETKTKVIGWRRPIQAKACEWCRVVATQLYSSAQTATFGHHGCRCKPPIAVYAGFDPVGAMNKAMLHELRETGAVKRVSEARERSRDRERRGGPARLAGQGSTNPAQALQDLMRDLR